MGSEDPELFLGWMHASWAGLSVLKPQQQGWPGLEGQLGSGMWGAWQGQAREHGRGKHVLPNSPACLRRALGGGHCPNLDTKQIKKLQRDLGSCEPWHSSFCPLMLL